MNDSEPISLPNAVNQFGGIRVRCFANSLTPILAFDYNPGVLGLRLLAWNWPQTEFIAISTIHFHFFVATAEIEINDETENRDTTTRNGFARAELETCRDFR